MGTDFSTPPRPLFHNNKNQHGDAVFGVNWSSIPALASTQTIRVCSKLFMMASNLSSKNYVTAFDVDSGAVNGGDVTTGFKYRLKYGIDGNYSSVHDNATYVETFEGPTNILQDNTDMIRYHILEYNPSTNKVTESWYDETKTLMKRFISVSLGSPSGEYFMTLFMPNAPGVNLLEIFATNLAESDCLAKMGDGLPTSEISMETWDEVLPTYEPHLIPYTFTDYKTSVINASASTQAVISTDSYDNEEVDEIIDSIYNDFRVAPIKTSTGYDLGTWNRPRYNAGNGPADKCKITYYNYKLYCGTRSPNEECKVLVWDLNANTGLYDYLTFSAGDLGLSGQSGVQDIIWHKGDMYCRSIQAADHYFICKFVGGQLPPVLLYSNDVLSWTAGDFSFSFCIHNDTIFTRNLMDSLITNIP